jgi:hypothetical protein
MPNLWGGPPQILDVPFERQTFTAKSEIKMASTAPGYPECDPIGYIG